MDATRLPWERGELFGLLVVKCDIAGAKAPWTAQSPSERSTSVAARSGRAKDLHEQVRAPEIDWRHLLEELCQRVIAAEERGKPIVLLRNVTSRNIEDRKVKAFGLPIPLDQPTIWYAAGGTGKSTLAAALAGELEQRNIPTLVADWETGEEDYRASAARIFGEDLPDIKYRRCDRPLVIEAQSIAQQIDECGIRYVIIDSADTLRTDVQRRLKSRCGSFERFARCA